MKNLLKLVLSFCFVLLGTISCNETGPELAPELSQEEQLAIAPREPEVNFSVDLPQLPIVAVDIIQREFNHRKLENGLTPAGLNGIEYLEFRLLELYPEIVQSGVIVKLYNELNEYRVEYEAYLERLRVFEISMGIEPFEEEYRPFTTLEEEVAYTAMTEEEIIAFKEREVLATSDVLISRDLLDELSAAPGDQKNARVQAIPVGIAVQVAVLAGMATSAWRVSLALKRTSTLEQEFYPVRASTGDRADAFTHIYASMYLRRYLTKLGSSLIMGAVEVVGNNRFAGDRQMDLHNNLIGRDTKYRDFRGSFFGDLNDWRTWGTNVRNYLSNRYNGMPMDQLHNWNSNTDVPRSRTIADTNINSQRYSSTRYVYYVNTVHISPCYWVTCRPGYSCDGNGNCIPDPRTCASVRCGPGEECINGLCQPF